MLDPDPELEKQLDITRSLGKLYLSCHLLTLLYQASIAQEPDIIPEPISVEMPSMVTLRVNGKNTM